MTYPLTTTLSALREAGACFEGYNKVVRMLQGRDFTNEDNSRESYILFAHKEPITLEAICSNNGLDDALWTLQHIKDNDRNIRLYAVWCARQAEHLSDDPCVKACNDVAERFANSMATKEDLDAAESAAESARCAATEYAARSAAWAAAQCASAESTAWSVAESAARSVAESSTWAATWSAWTAARAAQKEMFIKLCEGNAPW